MSVLERSLRDHKFFTLLALTAGLLVGCSEGGNTPGDAGTGVGPQPCSGFCYTKDPQALSADSVQTIIAQAVTEARSRGAAATIAVVDRVGNVLAVYRMDGARDTVRVGLPNAQLDGGLNGVSLVPAAASAIAKAVTGAYLSSEGNAFSTRSASQIVQENFNPGEINQPGGPLFGVQFSQLPCSDVSRRADDNGGPAPGPGPQRSPLGLSADPGGLPLYQNGTVVGGIGVEIDGEYRLDPSLFDSDRDLDELVAVAGSFGFAAPTDRRGDRITVEGKTIRFSDVDFRDLAVNPRNALAFGALTNGQLISVTGYYDAAQGVRAGTTFGAPDSGIRAAQDPAFLDRDAFVLVDENNAPRFPPMDGDGLAAAEVRSLLLSALDVANRARAQIRRPLGSPTRVTISVVDRSGTVVGLVRTRDAPLFGTDVAVQKARGATFASSASAASILQQLPDAGYLRPDQAAPEELRRVVLSDYVTEVRDVLGLPQALADGAFAFADRSIGNLSRPFFPDGIAGARHGPLSKPQGEWSPFSTGLQLDLVYNAVVRHVAFVAGVINDDVPRNCTGIEPLGDGLGVQNAAPQLANGIQIFPGSVPIYRGNTLVGGIGISGDGIEQDDMISFLGLHNAGVALGGAIGNAPPSMRADRISTNGVNLRYVQCPQAPFLNATEQLPCADK
ncbi:MAG: GlcG/HbpS family heme-binding protein [Algiphilus sp.]